jgi:hypothetical protein
LSQLCHNGDMVGHTGIMSAAIQACEAVDQCRKVITTALAHNYTTPLQIMEIVKRWLILMAKYRDQPAHWLHPIDPWWCIRWYCSNYFRTRGWKPEVMTCHSLLWKVHHRVINYRTIKLFLIRNRQEWKSGENGSKE